MAWIVFATTLVVYAWTAAPGLTWLDAPELATAATSLGIAHPPGHPIPSLLGRLVAFLPAGDLAFRVALASALAGAVAAAALSVAAATVVRRVAPAAPARLAGAAAGLGFAFSRSAWEQGTRAEVYALEAALVLLALAWLLDEDRRGLHAAGLALGLALANHHFVTLVFLAPALVAVALRRVPLAAVGRAAALATLGLGAFLYLPLRAARDVIGWGDPDRLDAFVWTVTARAFQKALTEALPPLAERAGDVATALVSDVTLPGAALALAGAYALARARASGALVLLAGALVLGALARSALGYDADNPDARGYLLPALAALFILGAAGLALVARALPRAALPVCVAALVLPAVQLARFGGDLSLRGAGAAEAYGRALLAPLPPRAVLVTSYFESTFDVRALQVLFGERPDVAVVDRKLLGHPFAAAAARRRLPELAGQIDARFRGPPGDRPLRFELAPDLDGDPASFVLLGELALPTPAPADRHGAERMLAWTAYLAARFHCAGGRRDAARAALTRARAHAAPGDPMLVELARSCDLP